MIALTPAALIVLVVYVGCAIWSMRTSMTSSRLIPNSEYVGLLLHGNEGSYSINDVYHRLLKLQGSSRNGSAEKEFKKAIKTTLQISGSKLDPKKPLRLNLSALVDV